MFASGRLIALRVFNEFLAVATKRNIALDDAVRAIGTMRRTFTTDALSEAAFDRGLWAIRSRHLSGWDAMLWATLDQVGCRTLLTEDFQDGRTLGGVTFLNPFEPANSEVVVALFRGAAPQAEATVKRPVGRRAASTPSAPSLHVLL